MNTRGMSLIVLAGSLLLTGCRSTTAETGESSTAGTPGSATTKPTYAPFTVKVGPPTKDIATPVTVQTEVAGNGAFIPPLILAWAKTGSRLYVTTYGSQTCPEVVDHVSSPGFQRLTLHTSMPFTGTSIGQDGETNMVCTADLSPTTSTVTVPRAIDPTVPVAVSVNGRNYTLPGRP